MYLKNKYTLFKCVVLLLISVFLLAGNIRGEDHYKPTWKSLSKAKIPEWLQDAKFGIYSHWGVYSIPAKGGAGAPLQCGWMGWGDERLGSKVRRYLCGASWRVLHVGQRPHQVGCEGQRPETRHLRRDRQIHTQKRNEAGSHFSSRQNIRLYRAREAW